MVYVFKILLVHINSISLYKKINYVAVKVICPDNYLFLRVFSINLLICSLFVVNSTLGHHQLITHQDPLLEVLSSF